MDDVRWSFSAFYTNANKVRLIGNEAEGLGLRVLVAPDGGDTGCMSPKRLIAYRDVRAGSHLRSVAGVQGRSCTTIMAPGRVRTRKYAALSRGELLFRLFQSFASKGKTFPKASK